MHKLVKQSLDKSLVYGYDIVFIRKGHFKVYLSKFGLTVRSQVLVSEAAGYLDVAVKAGIHEQLLIKLRRLGQRVEAARMHSGGYQIVARALGRGLYKARSLYIDKAVFSEIVAGDV